MHWQILLNLPLILQMVLTLVQMPFTLFLYECIWRMVNKHHGSAFVANDLRTRNSSTLRPVEPTVRSRFYCFSSLNEREHILFSAVVNSVVSSFVLSHSGLSPLQNPPCPQNSNHKYLPCLCISSSKNPPCSQNSQKPPVV